MNDKEYVDNKCSRCLNKYNDNDLCNIVQTIDGSFKCSNEHLGQAGEFIRTDKGFIFQIDEKKKNLELYFFMDAAFGKVKKHSMNINDIVENMDIIEYKLYNFNHTYITTVKEFLDPRSNQKKMVVDGYSLNQIQILKVLSHEIFNDRCFEVM